MHFRKLDLSQKEQRQALIDTFINAIYLYDDKVLITFNYKEGTETISFGEATEAAAKEKSSDMDCLGAPKSHEESKDSPWVFRFSRSLHIFAHPLHICGMGSVFCASSARRGLRRTKRKFSGEQ